MTDIQKRMKQAFAWMDRVSVSGDSVDFMAMARQELRAAMELEEAEQRARVMERAETQREG